MRWGDKITGDLGVRIRGQTAHWRWEHGRRGGWDGGERQLGGLGVGRGGQERGGEWAQAVAAVGRRILVSGTSALAC